MEQAVFIINSLQSGGAERVVATQANCMCRAGFGVTVILMHRCVRYALEPGVRVVALAETRAGAADLARLPALARALDRAIGGIGQRGNIVLITSNLPFAHMVTRLSHRARGALFVIHSMQNIVPFSRGPAYRMLVRWLYADSRVVTISDAVQRELRTVYRLPDRRMRTIYNPLDLAAIDAGMAEPVECERPFLLFCGRLDPVKRPDCVLDAFCRGGFSRDYDLVFLGEGSLRGRLEEAARKHGVADRVRFTGWVTNVYRWMHAASLLLLASRSEGASMVLMEALYCGCPVVAVRSGGPEELMTGPLADYLCAPDADSLAQTARRALREYPSGLRRFAQEFSAENNIRCLLEAYKDGNAAP